MAHYFDRNPENKDLRSQTFIDLTTEISLLIKETGAFSQPFVSRDLPYFSLLSNAKKDDVISSLESYLRIFAPLKGQSSDLTNSYRVVWQALKELELHAPSDFFSKLKDDYVIEIYSLESTQLFRNFKFFTCCSYSLEELCCRPWPELFDRDLESFEDLCSAVKNTFSGSSWESYSKPIKHFIREKDSLFKYEMNYFLLGAYPLKDRQGHVRATLVVEDAELLKVPSPEEEEKIMLETMKRDFYYAARPISLDHE
ncbi:hypothetical protein GW916_06960 [bacterium]|nr:hypothetical protein [bacterium]